MLMLLEEQQTKEKTTRSPRYDIQDRGADGSITFIYFDGVGRAMAVVWLFPAPEYDRADLP